MKDTKQEKWIELHIQLPEEFVQMFQLWLDDHGCLGLISNDSPLEGIIIYTAYFNWDVDRDELCKSLNNILYDYGVETLYKIGSLEKQDWMREFRDYFQPYVINDDIRIVCPWDKDKRDSDIVIKPEMAFGTGRHESTRLCLEYLCDIKGKYSKVLDIGTGSGILAITAMKCGANSVTAFDNDPEAAESCKRNLELNNIDSNKYNVFCGELNNLNDDSYDLIICNMLPKYFIPFMEKIPEYLEEEGRIIFSGIFDDMSEKVCRRFKELNMTIETQKKLAEWHAFEVIVET